jgi:hypothetical protein
MLIFAGRDDELRRHHDVLYAAVIGTPIPARQARPNVGGASHERAT